MENANVLVSAAGSIVAQGIIKSLKLANKKKTSPVTYTIITADMSAQAAGLYRGNIGVLVPPASSPDYVDFIIKICNEQRIEAIFVGADEELVPLALAKERIESKTSATLITNPIDVLTIATDKWKTVEFLKKNKLPYVESTLPEEQERFVKERGFPLVVKPREGHGSLHFYVVENKNELRQAISSIQKAGWHPILQELVKGEDSEFTSGITINKTGKYIMSSISMRRTIKSGQTYKAFIDDFDDVRKSAEEVAMKLGSIGPANIQARLDDGKPKVLEINPRFSATCPIRAVAGVNEPDIIFRNTVLGEDIKINSYQKLVCMRYWNEVYVPSSTYEKTVSTKKFESEDSFIPDYF